MYLSHFELHEKPFKISTDPKFLWLGEKHKEALEILRYGILHNDGYVVVTGDVGTGKTTLAGALINELGDRVIAAKVPYHDVDTLDFCRFIAAAYGIPNNFESKGSFLVHFESFLRRSFSAGQRVVLIVDEAQRLTAEHLNELLHLSNIEEHGTRLLMIVFVGQNEFNDLLLAESNRALRQRVTVQYNLGPLTQEETRRYIFHRLQVAHCAREIFAPEAIAEIFLFSGGTPRLINVVCDLALLLTYFGGGKMVRAETVKECVQKLRLPRENTGFAGNGSAIASGTEETGGNAIGEELSSVVNAGTIRENGRKRAWRRLTYAGAFGLLAVFGGFLFTFHGKGHLADRPADVQPKKELSQEAGTAESPREKRTPEIAPVVAKDTAPAVSPADGSDSSVQQKEEDRVPEPVKASKGTNIPSVKTASRETVGPGTSAGPVPKKATASLPKGKERNMGAQDPTALKDAKGRISQGSERRPGQPRETPEEIDPNKVIEWLLENRSGQR